MNNRKRQRENRRRYKSDRRRNTSGRMDMTAYLTIRNVMREEKKNAKKA